MEKYLNVVKNYSLSPLLFAYMANIIPMKEITLYKDQLENTLKYGILISFLIIIAIFFVTIAFGFYYAKKIADSIDLPLQV